MVTVDKDTMLQSAVHARVKRTVRLQHLHPSAPAASSSSKASQSNCKRRTRPLFQRRFCGALCAGLACGLLLNCFLLLLTFRECVGGRDSGGGNGWSGQRGRVLVAVMTAGKHLAGRAASVQRTWARSVRGRVMYFVGAQGPLEAEGHVPVHRLPGVADDVYPPQRKSWRMVRHMYDCCIDQYDWFMRADDDAFVRGERLHRLLARLDPSRPLFIGQPGQGNEEQLFWRPQDFFCMGGTGILFSRALLKRVAPMIKICTKQFVHTDHEDTELGRCVLKMAGVNCTHAFEMKRLMFHNSLRGGMSFNHSLTGTEAQRGAMKDDPFDSALLNAVTLHDVKKPIFHFRLANFFRFHDMHTLETRRLWLEEQLNDSLHKITNLEHLDAPWSAFLSSRQFSNTTSNPQIYLDPSILNALPHHLFQEMAVQTRDSSTLLAYSYAYAQHDLSRGRKYIIGTRKTTTKAFTVTQSFTRPRLIRVVNVDKHNATIESGQVRYSASLPALDKWQSLRRFEDIVSKKRS